MKNPSANYHPAHAGQHGGARIGLLVLALVLLAMAGGAIWYSRSGLHSDRQPDSSSAPALSEATMNMLQHLNSAVEIRFYSLLDRASVPASTFAFADRVDQLLSEYQRAADGKIRFVRIASFSDANAKAASADGIRPFNLDKGDACYLGLAVIQDNQTESLPQISPEWEQALEADVSRTIARLVGASQSRRPVVKAPTDTAVAEQVKRAIPNFAAVSIEDARLILRNAALDDFKATAVDMENQSRQAEQRLAEAQRNNSQAGQEAAARQLQQIRAEQTEKLKQIAARLQAQIETLEQLKGNTLKAAPAKK